jgi:hypothetical protein
MTLFRYPPLILVAGEVTLAIGLMRISDLPLAVRIESAALFGVGVLILQLVYWNQFDDAAQEER